MTQEQERVVAVPPEIESAEADEPQHNAHGDHLEIHVDEDVAGVKDEHARVSRQQNQGECAHELAHLEPVHIKGLTKRVLLFTYALEFT
jgi:hypothetical protein